MSAELSHSGWGADPPFGNILCVPARAPAASVRKLFGEGWRELVVKYLPAHH